MLYLAHDQTANRLVWLKVVPPHRKTSQNVARLTREGQTTAMLDHPGVLEVYEAGEADDYVYIALEHIEGETLAAVLESHRQTPFTVAQAQVILAKLAPIIDDAHQKGIIHGNLTPHDILLTQDDEVRVWGFGRVDLRTGVADDVPIEDARYMAPEQFDEEGEIDHRVDLYALGVLLYEMVTGAPPYGSTLFATLTYSVLRGNPRVPTLYDPTIADNIEGIILSAIAKEKAQRYTSATSLAEALARGMARANATENQSVTRIPPQQTASALAARATGLGSRATQPLSTTLAPRSSPASTQLPTSGARAFRQRGRRRSQPMQWLVLAIAIIFGLAAIVLGYMATGRPAPAWLIRPTATVTPTITPTGTLTPTDTPTPTITQTPSITSTFTPTNTDTPVPTDTVTLTPTQTETATYTINPKKALKAQGTRTPTTPPTRTKVVVIPTDTPIPTRTYTPTPTLPNFPSGNLLYNGNFERVFSERGARELNIADGWQYWFQDGPRQSEGYFWRPEYQKEDRYVHGDRRVREGRYAQKYFTTYATHNAGIWQRVPVVPGGLCTFTIWVQVWSSSGDGPDRIEDPGYYYVSVGMDPTGGTAWNGATVVWSEPIIKYNEWVQLRVSAIAQTDVVTVFTRGEPLYRVKHNDSYWDDGVLVEHAP